MLLCEESKMYANISAHLAAVNTKGMGKKLFVPHFSIFLLVFKQLLCLGLTLRHGCIV